MLRLLWIFDRAEKLPHLRQLMANGIYGPLRSCDPPITIPAWMSWPPVAIQANSVCMASGIERVMSITRCGLPTQRRSKRRLSGIIWGSRGKKSILVGVPPSYPPKPVKGELISCFITPSNEKSYTYPEELRKEIEEHFGPFLFDVVFRTEDRSEVLKEIYRMTDNHFQVVDYLLDRQDWSLFWLVEIGVDRMHHAFWKFMDKTITSISPVILLNQLSMIIINFLTKKIGQLLKKIDERTAVLVVSDHGAKGMKGAFCVNDWLIEQGIW